MRHTIYWAAVALTGVFAFVSLGIASTLLYGDVTLPKVLTAMLAAVIASATGAVGICTWQSPYDREQERQRRAFERLKNAGPPTTPETH